MDEARYTKGSAKRAEVLGQEKANSMLKDTSALNRRWQDYVIEMAWGECWSDPALSTRERTLLVLGAAAALRRSEEFEGHLRNAIRNGFTAKELEALVVQIAVYCGLFTGNMCTKALGEVLKSTIDEANR